MCEENLHSRSTGHSSAEAERAGISAGARTNSTVCRGRGVPERGVSTGFDQEVLVKDSPDGADDRVLARLNSEAG